MYTCSVMSWASMLQAIALANAAVASAHPAACTVSAVARSYSVNDWTVGNPVVAHGKIDRPAGIYRASDGAIYLTNMNIQAPVIKVTGISGRPCVL